MLLTKQVRKTLNRKALLFGLGGVAAMAVANRLFARRSERLHPPAGSFLTVDGARMHYTDRGQGDPVVLIHGNAVSGNDWDISGVSELLLADHRVIIFDRPGCGYSGRPAGSVMTAARQAEQLHRALQLLGVEKPLLVGHSWGTIVALAYAEKYQFETRGLVLLSGYYFWTLRPDVLQAALGAVPGLGDILRYTVSPLLGWLQMPFVKRIMFAPAQVTNSFQNKYSPAMALRPSQIRASCQDGASMIPSAIALRKKYADLKLAVSIIAGEGDKIVFKRNSESFTQQ